MVPQYMMPWWLIGNVFERVCFRGLNRLYLSFLEVFTLEALDINFYTIINLRK